jgi:tRNA A37 threonylcarbamoyladenosine synthetase subunit TsaC/SUA5/YrdC
MDFKARTIPTPGNLPDVKSDALQVFEVLQSGGITIIPSEVGYGLGASSVEAIEKAFAAKKPRPGHQLGIIGTYDLHREVHILDKDKFEMTES